MAFETPILLILFNRPDLTEQIFNKLKQLKPTHLFVAADGPRANKPGEAELCQETRAIVTQIDWECRLHTLYRETNLGCGRAVSGAITWFFKNVEEGIILEDDCLPDDSFFLYCQRMLELYRHDTRVMHIGGTNFQNGKVWGEEAYYFSKIAHVWGWASWRRAWQHYDFEVKSFYLFVREDKIYNYYTNKNIALLCLENFKKVYHQQIDTWDYQWTFCILNQGGVMVIPNVNLVSNLGFRADATHTTDDHVFANGPANRMDVTQLKLADSRYICHDADDWFYKTYYIGK